MDPRKVASKVKVSETSETIMVGGTEVIGRCLKATHPMVVGSAIYGCNITCQKNSDGCDVLSELVQNLIDDIANRNTEKGQSNKKTAQDIFNLEVSWMDGKIIVQPSDQGIQGDRIAVITVDEKGKFHFAQYRHGLPKAGILFPFFNSSSAGNPVESTSGVPSHDTSELKAALTNPGLVLTVSLWTGDMSWMQGDCGQYGYCSLKDTKVTFSNISITVRY